MNAAADMSFHRKSSKTSAPGVLRWIWVSPREIFTKGASESPAPVLINGGCSKPLPQCQGSRGSGDPGKPRQGRPREAKASASRKQTQGFWYRQGSILKPRCCRGFGAAGKERDRREKLDREQVCLGMVQPRSWRDVQGGTRSQDMMDSGSNTLRGCSGFVSASQSPRKDLQ